MSACRSKSDSAGESSFVFTAFLSYDFVAVLLQLVTLAVARSWMLALLLLYFQTILLLSFPPETYTCTSFTNIYAIPTQPGAVEFY